MAEATVNKLIKMSLSVLHRRHAQQHQHDALIDSLAFIHSSFIEHAAQVPYPTTLTVLDLHLANLQLHTIYDPCLSRSYLEGSRWRITQKSSHSHSHDGSVYNITFSNSSNFKLVSSAQLKWRGACYCICICYCILCIITDWCKLGNWGRIGLTRNEVNIAKEGSSHHLH